MPENDWFFEIFPDEDSDIKRFERLTERFYEDTPATIERLMEERW